VALEDQGGAHQKIERLRWAGVGAPIIIVAEHADVAAAVDAMKSGAFDVLAEPVDADRFVDVAARAIEADVASEAREHQLGNLRRNYARLTARERDVLYAITDGMLNKQAADRLGITEKTIKVHRARVMQKMGADSLPTLVRMVDAHRQVCGQEAAWPAEDPDTAAPLEAAGGGGTRMHGRI
jgi:FixJ family two-component response regulator